jgi:hypothetical protein
MTAIAGIVNAGVVWLGGDSACTNEKTFELMIQARAKVFKRGPFVIGGCGTAVWCELLARLRPPADAQLAWLTNAVSEAGHRPDASDAALVGFRGRLYSFEADGAAVYMLAGGFGAEGSGSPAVYGALFALRSTAMTPRRRLAIALEAAESRFANVRRPFRYVHT